MVMTTILLFSCFIFSIGVHVCVQKFTTFVIKCSAQIFLFQFRSWFTGECFTITNSSNRVWLLFPFSAEKIPSKLSNNIWYRMLNFYLHFPWYFIQITSMSVFVSKTVLAANFRSRQNLNFYTLTPFYIKIKNILSVFVLETVACHSLLSSTVTTYK